MSHTIISLSCLTLIVENMKYGTEYKGCNIVLCKTHGVISKTYRKERSGLDFESVPLCTLTAEAQAVIARLPSYEFCIDLPSVLTRYS